MAGNRTWLRWLTVATMTLTASCGSTTGGQAPPASFPAAASAAQAARRAGPMPLLPWAGDNAPWGGPDAGRWRPEAVLANATSQALNEAWVRGAVRDAIVAVPLKMYGSEFFPYGDGQANAVPGFETWKAPRPPVVATLVHFTAGSPKVYYRFDRALPGPRFELQYGSRKLALDATKDKAGDWRAEWEVPTDLAWRDSRSPAVALVRPAGWTDWFPLWFRMPVRPIPELLATVPAPLRKFSDGGGIVDHEDVSAQDGLHVHDLEHDEPTRPVVQSAGDAPFQRLTHHQFGGRYNQDPYKPDNIHGRFPYGGRQVVTGVGQGWTWVADRPAAPFKVLYTCFDRRHADLEASAPDGGVASGGGWHRIGDPAETILNDLEAGPLVVGTATGNPVQGSLPPGSFAYGLSDVANVRWLQPGEAFITRRGTGTQPNYHWFYFHADREVCTEEWVHPSVPNDRFDF